ncbi:siroheme synthase [Dacryopinax primogenitus]|uniref:precorrin-2 dehydrogenase n=1 Tax=Dacryopinax primogenitus (strain DJM 731) TaxID=1858805 RepID=M5FNQ0_DACPD|nr:siroheme synthase [Dacryopinax primogenitus]EJT97785.1 siroheme synthase [Dacryopinax primogenitus]
MSSSTQFPPLKGDASLLLAYQLHSKRVLLIGGGPVAASRLTHALEADALVTLLCPSSGLCPELLYRLSDPWCKSRITYHDRPWLGTEDLDLDGGADMVLSATDDPGVSKSVCVAARSRRVPVNVADVPEECDFHFGSTIRDGPLQVLVSTGGRGPKVANLIRRRLERALPEKCGMAIDRVGELRRRLRARAPGREEGKKRMHWMVGICEAWELEDLAELEEGDIEVLLRDGWEKGKVLSPKDLGKVGKGKEKVDNGLNWRREGIAGLLGAVVGAAVVGLAVFVRSSR